MPDCFIWDSLLPTCPGVIESEEDFYLYSDMDTILEGPKTIKEPHPETLKVVEDLNPFDPHDRLVFALRVSG